MKELTKSRSRLIDYYIASLEKGELPWRKGWNSNSEHFNPVSSAKYKGINQLLLNIVSYINHYKDPRWMTFRQIENKGYRLKNAKGKGIPLEKWSVYDKEKKEYINISDLKRIQDEENLSSDEIRSRFCWSCKTFVVFNAEHIEGIEPFGKTVNEFEVNRVGLKLVDRYSKNTDLKIIEGNESNGKCFYRPSEDTIMLPLRTDFFDEYSFLSTLLHECCHSTMHEKRMNRKEALGSFDSETYAREELRAEIGASFLCSEIGLEISNINLENHAAYINSWISSLKEKPQTLFEAIEDSKKIADYIENKGELEKIITEEKHSSLEKNTEIAVPSHALLNLSVTQRMELAKRRKEMIDNRITDEDYLFNGVNLSGAGLSHVDLQVALATGKDCDAIDIPGDKSEELNHDRTAARDVQDR